MAETEKVPGSEPLENVSKEKFCILFAQGVRQYKAYQMSGMEDKAVDAGGGIVELDNHASSGRANRLLKQKDVQDRYQFLRKEYLEQFKMGKDDLMRELGFLANGRASDMVTFGPEGAIEIKDSSELPEDVDKAITEVSSSIAGDGGAIVKIKRADKIRAMELIAKIGGYIAEKQEIKIDASSAMLAWDKRREQIAKDQKAA